MAGSVLTAVEIFSREADRLRSMADSLQYGVARDEFLRIADHYEALARHAEHASGQRPLVSRVDHASFAAAD